MAEEIVDARAAGLTALFDDAATFPPARRDVADAVVAHQEHRASDHAWLVGHFILSADRVASDGLRDTIAAAPGPDDIQLAVVVPRSRVGGLPPTLAGDLTRVAALSAVPQLSVRVVDVALQGHDPAADIATVLEGMDAAGMAADVVVACEIALAGRSAGEVLRRIDALAGAANGGRQLMAKLRLSGTMAGSVPSVAELAGFLQACADAEITTKAAAGPSHATPQANATTGETEHGFLSLLGAAATAHRGGSHAEIAAVLTAPTERVRLGPGALIIGDAVIESELLVGARRDLLRTISCGDLAGPVQQLIDLGALEESGARP